jgi:hypothetical protein
MNVGQELLPLSAAAGVGTLLVVEGMGRDEHIAASDRDQDSGGYLGEIVPDDAEAGRMLAEILTGQARERGLADGSGKIQAGVLAGEHTHAGNARFRGWMEVRKQHDDVVPAGFQYGSWEEEAGRSAAALLLQTAPGISVIWCANDAMALGALAAATEAGRRPGEDILIGGVDLSRPDALAACAKHFAGYGASESGRDYNLTNIGVPLLRNVYLPPFGAAVDAGVATFMAGVHELNGVPASGNEHLLRTILRGEWGFEGFVVSDWASIEELIPHGFAADEKEAAGKALIDRVDMEMATSGTWWAASPDR